MVGLDRLQEKNTMSSVGSYLSREGRKDSGSRDLNWLCSTVVKILGEQPSSFGALLSSLTGASEDDLRQALALLHDDKLVAGDDREFFLTDLGRKARFVVA